jgi:Mce-associated membrane protein
VSPRRLVGPDDRPLFVEQDAPPSRALAAVLGAALVLATAAITVCALVLISHAAPHRAAMRDVEVLGDVESFMAMFTSPDPFHANDYVADVMAHATGDFEKECQDKANKILLAVARSERTTGTVVGAGVERWNDDGTANVLVAVENSGKTPDGKQDVSVASRWLLTAQKEGDQWKISNLNQVL